MLEVSQRLAVVLLSSTNLVIIARNEVLKIRYKNGNFIKFSLENWILSSII